MHATQQFLTIDTPLVPTYSPPVASGWAGAFMLILFTSREGGKVQND
jgi:hypothetical protein